MSEWGANYIAEEDALCDRRAFLEFVECNVTNVADLLVFFPPAFFFKAPKLWAVSMHDGCILYDLIGLLRLSECVCIRVCCRKREQVELFHL